MPCYAEVLKVLLTNKKKLEKVSTVTFGEECSTVLSNQLPKKEKDLRSFVIPHTIGGVVNEKTLADLGASINLITYKIFQKLGLGEPKLMTMTFQLVDQLIRHSRNIIKEILVKVGKFIFSVDCVILDLDDKMEVRLIIGQQVLATSQALIDVKNGNMVLRVGEEEVAIKLWDTIQHSVDFNDSC